MRIRAMLSLCLINESKHAEVACARQLYNTEGVAGFTRGADLPFVGIVVVCACVVEVEVLKTQNQTKPQADTSRLNSVKVMDF